MTMMAVFVLLLLLVMVMVENCLASAQCVGLEGLEPGWQLEPQGQVRKPTPSLEACRRLCVHWTPCRTCSFRPDQRLCLLSASPPRQPSTPQSYGEGEFVFHVVNTTECQSKGPCHRRPCAGKETCMPVKQNTDYVCLQGQCPGKSLVYVEGVAVCVNLQWEQRGKAAAVCRDAGGFLYMANTPSKFQALLDFGKAELQRINEAVGYYWVGLTRTDDNAPWLWDNGEPENKTFLWSPYQPDAGAHCAYVKVARDPNDVYVDNAPCTETMQVVCEFQT